MITLLTTHSCLVGDLAWISHGSPKDVVMAVCRRLDPNSREFYKRSILVFSQGGGKDDGWFGPQPRYGDKLMEFILENNLGSVVASPKIVNAIHFERKGEKPRNCAYLWTLDFKALDRWYRRELKLEPKSIYAKPTPAPARYQRDENGRFAPAPRPQRGRA